MADVTLTYKGATIGELSESGNKTIKTAGKYCEADILLGYVKPQSGGAVLLADETLTEDTFTFEIPFTEAMRGYDLYKVVATGLIVGGNFLYFSVNTAQRTRYWNISSMGYVAFVESSLLFGAAYSIPFTPPIQKIIAEPYSNTGTLKSGFNIKVWGYKN